MTTFTVFPFTGVVGQHVSHTSVGIFYVDAYGAVGDCPITGSTAGATDDSAAFEAAFAAMPANGRIKLTEGKVYMVSRRIDLLGKSLTFDMTGATIRCRDNSVWNVFTFGGASLGAPVESVTILGGTFDGNLRRQRYWPNQNATHIYTDNGYELLASYTGTPFYENSLANGTVWNDDWINGSNNNSINLNGGGNGGLIRVQHAETAQFHSCKITGCVRNGLATWAVGTVLFDACEARGGLSMHFAEVNVLFGAGGYESAYFKTAGENSAAVNQGGTFTKMTIVRNCITDGGHMPFFGRTNSPKNGDPDNQTVITGCRFTNFSRDVWSETNVRVTYRDCFIVGGYHLNSTFRKDPGVFVGNGANDFLMENCQLIGPVNFNEKQANRNTTIRDCHILSECDTDKVLADVSTIENTIVLSKNRTVRARTAKGCQFYSEAATYAIQTANLVDCDVGRLEYQGIKTLFIATAGQSVFSLPAGANRVTRVRMRRRALNSGYWYELHSSDFSYNSGPNTVSFPSPFVALAGDEIEVDWRRERAETFVATAAQFIYNLTEVGAQRPPDVTLVRVAGVPILHRRALESTGVTPHWTMTRLAGGLSRITLVNVTVAADAEVFIRYEPPRKVYGGVDTIPAFKQSSISNSKLTSITRVQVQDEVELSVSDTLISDTLGETTFTIGTGSSLLLASGTVVSGSSGTVAAGANLSTVAKRAVFRGAVIENWASEGAALSSTLMLRMFGGNNNVGQYVKELFELTNSTLIRSNAAASNDIGRMRGSDCERRIYGGNALFGVTTPNLTSHFAATTALAKPDAV